MFKQTTMKTKILLFVILLNLIVLGVGIFIGASFLAKKEEPVILRTKAEELEDETATGSADQKEASESAEQQATDEAGLKPTTGVEISPNITISPIVQTGDTTLNLSLKFQGILNKPAVSTMTVRIILASESGHLATQSAVFNADEQGVWRGTAVFKNIVDSGSYRLKIKGPKHLQKVICEAAPKETELGKYKCEKGAIALKQGDNKSFDFSNILLLTGDLPDENNLQDGKLTTGDLIYVLNNQNSTDVKVLGRADLNFDGIVNTTDLSLIKAAYSLQVEDQN